MEAIDKLKYNTFLVEEMTEQAEFERYVNECLLICEGEHTIKNITILNEGFADKIKAGIIKLAQAIGAIWKKFLEAINTLVKTDKAYLDKYKDIILKKKMFNNTYTMYNYPVALKDTLVRAGVPQFNYERMKESLKDEESFIDAEFNHFQIQGSKESFEDQMKSILRGGGKEEPIAAAKLNMTDMFNFCYTYDSIQNNLKKDKDNIQNAATAGIDLLDKMVRTGQVEEVKESYYYSNVYNRYIQEAANVNIEKENGDKSSSGSSSTTTKSKDFSNPANNANSPQSFAKNNQNVTTHKDDPEKIDNEKNLQNGVKTNKEAEDASKRIQIYMKICGQFLAAKATVFEEIFKTYMIIIKDHVRDHLGKEKDTDTDKSKDTTVDYSNAKSTIKDAMNPDSTNPKDKPKEFSSKPPNPKDKVKEFR